MVTKIMEWVCITALLLLGAPECCRRQLLPNNVPL
jgi:hypothetical protein